MSRDLTDNRLSQHVSTGAGIAIAGIWLSSAALTGLLTLIAFVWEPAQAAGTPAEQPKLDGGEAFLLLFLLALPMIAAFIATMRILGRDD
jgi:hypothetical protein